jgi:hypothetical protein
LYFVRVGSLEVCQESYRARMGVGSGTLMLLVRRAPSVMAWRVLVKEMRERGLACIRMMALRIAYVELYMSAWIVSVLPLVCVRRLGSFPCVPFVDG